MRTGAVRAQRGQGAAASGKPEQMATTEEVADYLQMPPHLGREIGRLQEAAAGLEREIGRGCWGANGTVLPYLLERRKQLVMDLAAVRADIAALKGMTDHACQVWASDRGVR